MNLIERIQKDFSLSLHDVHVLVFTASRRYKLHYIEKRHGRGKRLIAQPTAEIKMLQRWAVEKYLHLLPIHKVATAYRPRVSIKDHAKTGLSGFFSINIGRAFFNAFKIAYENFR
jgi:RNA-directed DNA polymerase